MKHTPGTWVLYQHDYGAFTITDEYDNTITSRAHWSHRAEESHANARLIAAAPELLEALKTLDEQITAAYANGFISWLPADVRESITHARLIIERIND